ncbi:hypothetical protein AB2F98_01670 [Escherichia coli]
MLRSSGELVHPDFGTVAVMVDSWECRTKADELNYYAFTVTVYPSRLPRMQPRTQKPTPVQPYLRRPLL